MSKQDCSRRAFLGGSALMAGAAALTAAAPALANEAGELASGTYTGKANGRTGVVEVELYVDRGCILEAKATATGETATLSDAAMKKVCEDIVHYQSLYPDTVSGATLTSFAVRLAAAEALEQAGDTSAFEGDPAYPAPLAEDCETDVLVIGAGNAGMNAVAKLRAAGLDVILVEKQGLLGGGDSTVASTSLNGGGGYGVYKSGVEDSTEEDYYASRVKASEKSTLPVDLDCLRAYCMKSGELVDYYIQIGVPFGRFSGLKNYIVDGSAPGGWVIKRLAEQMDALGVDYRLNTKLESLVVEDGAVVGAVVSNASGEYAIRAKAVLLACGGFAYNEDMLAEYADAEKYRGLPHSGTPSSMGEGILAAIEVGADLFNMTAKKVNNICHVAPNGAVNSLATIQIMAPLFDDNGNRFIDEFGSTIQQKADAELELPNKEAWAIFGQDKMDSTALLREYDALGYFVKGDTWEELAEAMGFDAEAAANFVDGITRYTSVGVDGIEPDFGTKVPNAMEQPPYYAVLIQPAIQGTYGGVRTDAGARALDVDGNHIPGLYAAGSVAGHSSCVGSDVGHGLTISGTFGMIAGETIVADLAE